MELGGAFHQKRLARYLLMYAILSPLIGPLAVLVSPLLSVVAVWRAKRWRLLYFLGLGIVLTAGVGTALAFGGALLEGAPSQAAPPYWFTTAAALVGFLGICLSSPLWMALTLWGEGRSRWAALGYGLALTLAGVLVPTLLTALVGVHLGGLGLVISVIALFFGSWPILKQIPPIPELLPLVEALQLEPTNEGWRGADVYLGRRGQLTLDLPFRAPIPGLFARKRGQLGPSEHPLLGDAVLDSTLELALPSAFSHLTQDPALLLEAVHGAQVEVGETGLHLKRQLDRAAFKADPWGSRDRVLRELESAQELYDILQALQDQRPQ